MTRDELKGLVDFKKKQLAELLNQLEAKAQISPAKARNYAMATKPFGVRVGWKCNYKNALHSSPCGCAKPHLGGRWVVLGENEKVKED